jgi:hypothetical protein
MAVHIERMDVRSEERSDPHMAGFACYGSEEQEGQSRRDSFLSAEGEEAQPSPFSDAFCSSWRTQQNHFGYKVSLEFSGPKTILVVLSTWCAFHKPGESNNNKFCLISFQRNPFRTDSFRTLSVKTAETCERACRAFLISFNTWLEALVFAKIE